ncbi:MAG: hypothetical protein PUJ82_14260 [Spirochaetales bacterium]|nr:hypothetical protein [Spirochaetales bacterium]
MLRKKSEKCIAFLVPSLHCKLALSGVPLSLQPLPSLRSVQWPPSALLLSLPRFKHKNSISNQLINCITVITGTS